MLACNGECDSEDEDEGMTREETRDNVSIKPD
jgi:hypothetical protein